MPDDPRPLFISYSRGEAELARRLAETLRASGEDPWLAAEHVEAGTDVRRSIHDAIHGSQVFVLMVGPDQSTWNRSEMSEMLKRAWSDESVVILPVLVDGAEPPGYLRDQAAVHVDRDGHGLDEVVQRLGSGVDSRPGRTEEGDKRLGDRLAEIEQAADAIAERG
jgi:hypothetical protein